MKFTKLLFLMSILISALITSDILATKHKNKKSLARSPETKLVSKEQNSALEAFGVLPKDIWSEIIDFLIADQKYEVSFDTIDALISLRKTSKKLNALVNFLIAKTTTKMPVAGGTEKLTKILATDWLKNNFNGITAVRKTLKNGPEDLIGLAVTTNHYKLLEAMFKHISSERLAKFNTEYTLEPKINFNKLISCAKQDGSFASDKIIKILENRLSREKRVIYGLCAIALIAAILEEYILANLSDYLMGREFDICYTEELSSNLGNLPYMIIFVMKIYLTISSSVCNMFSKNYGTPIPPYLEPPYLDFEGPKNLTNYLLSKNQSYKNILKNSENIFQSVKNKLGDPVAWTELISFVVVFLFYLDFHLKINSIIREF